MKGKVIAIALNIRSNPSLNASILGILPQGSIVIIDKNKSISGWYFIYYGNMGGFISARYIQLIDEVTSIPPIVNIKVTAQGIIDFAKTFLGVPYLWGGTTPLGFDCSGFVQYVFKNFGINIPRVTYDQAKVGINIPVSNIQKGDLGFFNPNVEGLGPEHATIYVADGLFIHAPHKGSYVKIDRMYGCYIARRVI